MKSYLASQFIALSFFLGLFSLSLASGLSEPRETGAIRIEDRTPPTRTEITVASQTAVITGDAQTWYLSYSGQTVNSKVTQTIQGTPTILPVWYCDPTLTAPVCKSCPTSTASGQPPCPTDFNFLLVLPLVAVVGGIVFPPAGLPTLTIGPDGDPTAPPDLNPTVEPPSGGTSSSDTSISVSVLCTAPSIRADALAASVETAPAIWIPPTGSPAPTTVIPPVIQMTNADLAHPTLWGSCGPGEGNPYYSGGFFQFGNSFSRDAGNDAIIKFCNDMIAQKKVVGPDGSASSGTNSSPNKAVAQVVQTYDESDGSGAIMIRIQADVNNLSQTGQKCPGNQVWDFQLGGYALCRQLLGQSVDYCDNDKTLADSDITWKHGGTWFTQCTYFTVQKSPTGGNT